MRKRDRRNVRKASADRYIRPFRVVRKWAMRVLRMGMALKESVSVCRCPSSLEEDGDMLFREFVECLHVPYDGRGIFYVGEHRLDRMPIVFPD